MVKTYEKEEGKQEEQHTTNTDDLAHKAEFDSDGGDFVVITNIIEGNDDVVGLKNDPTDPHMQQLLEQSLACGTLYKLKEIEENIEDFLSKKANNSRDFY